MERIFQVFLGVSFKTGLELQDLRLFLLEFMSRVFRKWVTSTGNSGKDCLPGV